MGTWIGDYNNMLLGLARDADSAWLVRRGLNDFAGLTANDQLRFHAFMTQILLSSLYLFDQRNERAFDRIGDQILRIHAAMFKTPGGRRWWDTMVPLSEPEFRTYMDGLIRSAASTTDGLPWFQGDAL